MPLFGHKQHDNATPNAGYNNPGYDNAAAYDNSGTSTTGIGRNRLHKNQGAHNDPSYPSPNAPGADNYGQQAHGMGMGDGTGRHGGFDKNPATNDLHMNDDQYGQPGRNSDGSAVGATTGAAHHGMAPQTNAAGNPAQPHGGGGSSRFVGKVESAVGTMLGSESLKRKGMEKEQESQALKVQAAELSEAERLEQAALARRQRAVAHGAHPDHKFLGSHNPGAGAANVDELGGGANTGAGGVGGAGSNARGGY